MNVKWSYLFVFLIALIAGIYLYNKYRVAPSLNFKNIELSSLDGQAVKLDSFQGKSTILSFGASWCGSCITELNDLSELPKDQFKNVQVLVISDEPIERIIRFKERYKGRFVFLRSSQRFDALGIHSLPTSYLLNKRFEIKKEKVGFINWSDPSTAAHLLKLIE